MTMSDPAIAPISLNTAFSMCHSAPIAVGRILWGYLRIVSQNHFVLLLFWLPFIFRESPYEEPQTHSLFGGR